VNRLRKLLSIIFGFGSASHIRSSIVLFQLSFALGGYYLGESCFERHDVRKVCVSYCNGWKWKVFDFLKTLGYHCLFARRGLLGAFNRVWNMDLSKKLIKLRHLAETVRTGDYTRRQIDIPNVCTLVCTFLFPGTPFFHLTPIDPPSAEIVFLQEILTKIKMILTR